MPRRQPYGWLGAGALTLGVGVALAGAGAAHADDTSPPAATSSVTASATPGTTVTKSSRPPGAPSRTARPAPRVSMSTSTAARSATVLSRPPEVPSAAASRSRRQATVLQAPAAAVTAAPNGWVTPVPSQATIAVTNWFSSTRSWLYQFDGPLAEGLRNTLTGVQRTLFSPAPTVKPVQLTAWTPGEEILGELRYVQPGGAGVSIELIQAPTSGAVQLLSDGTYTFTPGAGFTGTDTFTAQVTSAGFNILEPSTPRTSTVTVGISPTIPVGAYSKGINIYNMTAHPITLTKWWTESGYEQRVDGPPMNTIVPPGDYRHFELDDTVPWKTYDTRARYAGQDGAWQVVMHRNDAAKSFCETGDCLVFGDRGFIFLVAPAKSVTDVYPTDPNASTYLDSLLRYTDGGDGSKYLPVGKVTVDNFTQQLTSPYDYTNAQVIKYGVNDNSRPYTYSQSETFTFSATTGSSWKVSAGLKILALKLGAEYGRSYSETETSSITQNVNLTFPAYSQYAALKGGPTINVVGDIVITWLNGSKTVFHNFDATFPDPKDTKPTLQVSSFFGPITAGFSVKDKNPPVRPDNPPGVIEPTYAVGNVAQLFVQGYAGDTVNGIVPDFTNPSVGVTTFTSSNPAVARVDAKGKLTAIGVGDSTISVNYSYTLPLGGGQTWTGSAEASMTVHVKER